MASLTGVMPVIFQSSAQGGMFGILPRRTRPVSGSRTGFTSSPCTM